MEIRFAMAQDVPGIIKLLQQMGSLHHEGRPDLFPGNAQKYGASQVMGMLGKQDAPVFVAVKENKVLGCCFCTIEHYHQQAVMRDHTTLRMDDICLSEEDRGQCVGNAIFDEILKYAKYRGCYNVTANVWSCNESAMALCESLGMKPQKVSMEAIL